MELVDIIKPYVGQNVLSAEKESNTLKLGFIKKILFIKKKVTVSVIADEDISSLSVKSLVGGILKEVTYSSGRIKFVFTEAGKASTYSFVFKASKAEVK